MIPEYHSAAMGPTPEDEYGLSAVAEHNAASNEQFPVYEEDVRGLGIYQQEEYSNGFFHHPPTPHSASPSDGIRTRSGRSTGRADSPFSATTKSRASKSPMPRSKRDKKGKSDKAKTPKLTAPLSILTKDMDVPLKNMNLWVNRPADVRREEVEKRNGYVTRPMNSFMLYRSAYADRTKQWCLQNNHQVVSSVSGESWPMEPPEVRDKFNEWAKIERANHAAAHPTYKFSPSKTNNKKRKGDEWDGDDEPSDLDDPDAEYRAPGSAKHRKRNHHEDATYLPANHGNGYETTPYYTQPNVGYDPSQYPLANGIRPLPFNMAFNHSGLLLDQPAGSYLPISVRTPAHYAPQVTEVPTPRVPTPQSLGGYGLPGGQVDDMFASSQDMVDFQHYQQFGQPFYPYSNQMPQQAATYQPQNQQLFEHQQYLQMQMQPQQMVDPALEAALNAAAAANGNGLPTESHFDDAIGDIGPDLMASYYYEQQISPNTTLAPNWPSTDALK